MQPSLVFTESGVKWENIQWVGVQAHPIKPLWILHMRLTYKLHWFVYFGNEKVQNHITNKLLQYKLKLIMQFTVV